LKPSKNQFGIAEDEVIKPDEKRIKNIHLFSFGEKE
jgi:hypothetical protein